jgi:hypothetical protein
LGNALDRSIIICYNVVIENSETPYIRRTGKVQFFPNKITKVKKQTKKTVTS